MRTVSLILVIAIYILFQTTNSDADVLIEDGAINSASSLLSPSIEELDIPSGSGQAGDFLLLTCTFFRGGTQQPIFNLPSPAIFTDLINPCGATPVCNTGIWGGFTNNPASEDLICNTNIAVLLLAGGALRYSNVDTDNPIIDVQCNQGSSNMATAPSIMTEAGSQVVRIFSSRTFFDEVMNSITIDSQMANFTSEVTIDSGLSSSIAASTLFNSAGPTGTADESYLGPARDWSACTIALRMLPAPPTPTPTPPVTPTPTTMPPPDRTSVPTLNEWGHLTIAIFILLIGVWFYRRHKVKT